MRAASLELPRFEANALQANLALVDRITLVADRRETTSGPPTSTSPPDDLTELDDASSSARVRRERYPEALQK